MSGPPGINGRAVNVGPSATRIGNHLVDHLTVHDHRGRTKSLTSGRAPDGTKPPRAMDHAEMWKCLDDANHQLTSGAISSGMGRAAEILQDCRDRATPADWKMTIAGACRGHAICSTLLEDPFTARSFYKPRGYPGDAVLLDLIYGLGERDDLLHQAALIGQLIYHYSSNRFAPNAVRWRCQHIAERIDEIAQHRGPLRILSVASGHARELKHSRAAHGGGISEFVAIDADRQTLDVTSLECNGVPITTIAANVKILFNSRQNLGRFDLVYSLGLFDYLSERTASRLLASMAELACPGGQVVVANFAPVLPDAGYMEAYMDWWLCYREEGDLRKLCHEAGLDGYHTYSDPSRCLAVLRWARPR